MAKQYKVKRYHRIYRGSPGRQVGRIVLIVVVFCVLFAIGWLLYQPIYNMILGQGSASSSEAQSASQEEVQSQEQRAVPQPEPAEAYKMAYLPANVLTDQETLGRYLATCKEVGANSVVIDLKDVDGNLCYRSVLPQAHAPEVGGQAVYDLPATVKTIRAAGMRTVGRVFAFADKKASLAYPEMAVKYRGTDYTWLDNNLEAGGEPWLNPCSQEAQDYVLSVIAEGMDAGVQAVALDGVQFPTGYGLDLAVYLPEEEEPDRPAVLTDFLDRAESLVDSKGGDCWLTVPAGDLLTEDTDPLSRFGGDAAQVAQDRSLLLGVMPGSLSTQALERLPATATQDAHQAVTAQLAILQLDEEQTVVPIVQAFTSGETAVGKAEVDQQLEACTEAGLTDGYFLYNPAGNYEFMN